MTPFIVNVPKKYMLFGCNAADERLKRKNEIHSSETTFVIINFVQMCALSNA